MPETLLIPDGESTSEFVEKKSRFIGKCFYISEEKDAKEIVKKLRSEHPEARHICWAFVIGEKNSQKMGMSDDGEPKGTAGRPILNVLAGSGITNIICTVIRYFGGTLLGTGGLVRAYTKSAKDTIGKLPTKHTISEICFEFSISYELYNPIKYLLKKYDAKIKQEQFTEKIKISTVCEELKFQDIKREILNFTAGKIKIKE